MNTNTMALPPWSLSGNAVILMYRFPSGFSQQYGFMEEYQLKNYKGRVGLIMLVDYKTSNIGSYRELLFTPGLFKLGGRTTFSISKIYVSSYTSVLNGIANWGIPKELADFTFSYKDDSLADIQVHAGGNTFFNARIKSWGPRFPLSSKILPWCSITQQVQDQLLLTTPIISGKTRLASIKDIQVNADFFVPIHQLRPLVVLSVNNFLMTFPAAVKAPLLS
jgi:hypothetical protein